MLIKILIDSFILIQKTNLIFVDHVVIHFSQKRNTMNIHDFIIQIKQ